MVFDMPGQGWLQLGELTTALFLCALLGLERELRQKSAGFRTYTLVGVSAALFMLISKYGFMACWPRARWSSIRHVWPHKLFSGSALLAVA